MTRWLTIALCMALAWATAMPVGPAGAIGADDPPLRLKKKTKPVPKEQAEPTPEKKTRPKLANKKPKKDERPEEEAWQAAQKAKEALSHAAQGMRDAEKRLAHKDPGDATRQIQCDVLKNLDELIKQTQRQQQQQQQQTASSSQSRRRSSSERQSAQRAGNRRQQSEGRQQADSSARKNANRPGMGGVGDRGASNKIADIYKDVWGNLPETMRQEMDQYSREQFMAKYGDLLKHYYSTIAAKGKRKE